MSYNKIIPAMPTWSNKIYIEEPPRRFSKELCRLTTAIAVSKSFFELLKSNPQYALDVGYYGRCFHLLPYERQWVLQGRFDTPQEFGQYLVNQLDRMPLSAAEFEMEPLGETPLFEFDNQIMPVELMSQ